MLHAPHVTIPDSGNDNKNKLNYQDKVGAEWRFEGENCGKCFFRSAFID